MKTNKLMDEIRKSTPADTNKQVDLCVAIANRVFELLQERNMKQRDFAKALGKTETEVSRWLSGTHNLTLATIAKMATVLGDDIITTTQSHRPYKLPNTQNVAMMVAEDMCKKIVIQIIKNPCHRKPFLQQGFFYWKSSRMT